MFSPIAFYRFCSVLSAACLLCGIACGDEFGLLLFGALGLACLLGRLWVAHGYPEVKQLPLVPYPHLAARRRLLIARLAKLPHLARVGIFGAVATGVFFALPDVLRYTIMPTAGGFTPDNIGAAALGAFQFFAALSMAYVSWRYLFPGLYAYAVETMEGKLMESITSELLAFLPAKMPLANLAASQGKSTDQLQRAVADACRGEFERLKEFGIRGAQVASDKVALEFQGFRHTVANTPTAISAVISAFNSMPGLNGNLPQSTHISLAELAERRKIATLTFTIRCARFVFSVSPFVFFFVQANHALASALIAVPPAAVGL